MKILVTGGAGFIGSHITDRYIGLGHEVVVIDNLSTGKRSQVNKKAQFYEADIRDRKDIEEIIKKESPQVINHHAAQMDVRKSVADPVYDAQVNLIGLLNLMESGRAHGLEKVIFASSGGTVYGDTERLPTPETAHTQPASPYGISKLTSEYYLDFYLKTYSISYVSLRYGNVYGPRQNPHGEAGVVAIFTQKLLAGDQPIINGDGAQTRDYVFVADLVEANVQSLEVKNRLIANIGTSTEVDVNKIFKELALLTKSGKAPVHGPAKSGEQKRSCLDISLAKKELHWEATTSLNKGLHQTVAYFAHEKNA